MCSCLHLRSNMTTRHPSDAGFARLQQGVPKQRYYAVRALQEVEKDYPGFLLKLRSVPHAVNMDKTFDEALLCWVKKMQDCPDVDDVDREYIAAMVKGIQREMNAS